MNPGQRPALVPSASTAGIRIRRGDEACLWLADPGHQAAWVGLSQACPWSSVFQLPPFVEAWYHTYLAIEEPVIVTGEDQVGGLTGLLLLARHRQTGALAPAGTHHAEYQSWLALPGDDGAFIAIALAALSAQGLGQRLTFAYLTPGTPPPPAAVTHRHGVFTLDRRFRRGLVALRPGPARRSSLRKKSNRSRLRRLERLGPVTLRQLTSVEELARALPTIAAWCDLRQGALNASTPFRSDPLKAEFYLRMMAAPGLLHATILQAGDHPIACHIGPINGREVALGLIAHSPLHAEHSPGKLLLLLLFEQLAEQGFDRFDLTPGGDAYKDRFATDSDDVLRLDCFMDAGLSRRARASRAARGALGGLSRAIGVPPGAVRDVLARVTEATQRLTARGGPSRMARGWGRSPEILLYRREAGPPGPTRMAPEFGANRIGDLVAYQRPDPSWPSVSDFLRDASRRLESGQVAHTLVVAGRLVACGWLVPSAADWPQRGGPDVALPEPGTILLQGWTQLVPGGRVGEGEWLEWRLAHAAASYPPAPVYLELASGSHSAPWLATQGLVPVGRRIVRHRWGRRS